jgi:hypothetical protein
MGTYAQIKTNFWGLTLGVSSKEFVIKTLRSKGYSVQEFFNINHQGVQIKNVIWADAKWDYCYFQFTDNKLRAVVFETSNQQLSDSELVELKNRFVKSYEIKYKEYFDSSISEKPNSYNYCDGKTHIGVELHPGTESGISHINFLHISYDDNHLTDVWVKQKVKSHYDEL